MHVGFVDRGGHREDAHHRHQVVLEVAIEPSCEQRKQDTDADAQHNAAQAEQFGPMVQARAALHRLGVIVELPRLPGCADPIGDHDVDPRLGLRRGCQCGFQSGSAHHVADPFQAGVLLLQEVVVRECRARTLAQPRPLPVGLDAQAFGERAVIQVLALPVAAAGHPGDRHAGEEHGEESVNHQILAGDVGVREECGAHQARKQIGRPQDPVDPSLVQPCKPVRGFEQRPDTTKTDGPRRARRSCGFG